MKVVFVAFAAVILLTGTTASPVEAKSIELPEWITDLIDKFPDSLPEIIDRLPEIIEAIRDKLREIIPAILENLPEILDSIEDRLEEVLEIIIERLPEILEAIRDIIPVIIEQIPAFIDRIREAIIYIIDRIPELVPVLWERIFELLIRVPEIYDAVRDFLENLDIDWIPDLPDIPEWWPQEVPEIPQINRPVAGSLADIEQYSSAVQIEIGTGAVWIQYCVGNIITAAYVLSTARCFSGNLYDARFRRVRAGSSSRFGDGLIVSVADAVVHPDFGENSFDADIAVVRLSSLLTFSPSIQQIAIVTQDFVLPAGLVVNTTGWGSISEGGLFSDPQLHSIQLAIINQEVCASRWVGYGSPFSITNNMICVGRPETGGRNGDIRDRGAPIIFDNILVGIVSFSAPIGNQFFPVVATSISSYTNWIIQNAS